MINKTAKIFNDRADGEYRLVTDGKTYYRLHPNFKIPKGVFEVKSYYGKSVYARNGKLKAMFAACQRIQPRNNVNYLTRSIRAGISGSIHNVN